MKSFSVGIDFSDVQSAPTRTGSLRTRRSSSPSSHSLSSSSQDQTSRASKPSKTNTHNKQKRSNKRTNSKHKKRKKDKKDKKNKKNKKKKKKTRDQVNAPNPNPVPDLEPPLLYVNRKRKKPNRSSSASSPKKRKKRDAQSHRYFSLSSTEDDLLKIQDVSNVANPNPWYLTAGYIPLDAPSSTKPLRAWKTAGDNDNDSELRALNQHVADVPSDEAAWLEKISLHIKTERSRARSGKARKGFHDRLVSIYDKALQNVPRSVRLHVGKLRIMSEIVKDDRVDQQLSGASGKGDGQRRLGNEEDGGDVLSGWYTSMKDLRYHPLVCQGFFDFITMISAPVSHTVRLDSLKKEMVTVFVNCARYWRMDPEHFRGVLGLFESVVRMYEVQGFKELAVACFQALFEFTSDGPFVTSRERSTNGDAGNPITKTPVESFSDFWESEFPRAGEPTTSGWAAWSRAVYPGKEGERGGKGREELDMLDRMVVDLREGLTKEESSAGGEFGAELLEGKASGGDVDVNDSDEELDGFNLDQLRQADNREFEGLDEPVRKGQEDADADGQGDGEQGGKQGAAEKFYVYSPIHGRRIFVGSKDEQTVAVNSSRMYLAILKDIKQDEPVFPAEFKHSSKNIHQWTRAEAREDDVFHAPLKTGTDALAALDSPESVPFTQEVTQLLFPLPSNAEAARVDILRHFLRHLGVRMPYRFALAPSADRSKDLARVFHAQYLYNAVSVEGLKSFVFSRNSSSTFLRHVLLRGIERFGALTAEFMVGLIWEMTQSEKSFAKVRMVAKRLLSFVEATQHPCRYQAWTAFAEAESVKGQLTKAQKVYNKVIAAAISDDHADASCVALSFGRFKVTLLVRNLCLHPANIRNRIIRTFACASRSASTRQPGFHRQKHPLTAIELTLCRQGFNERCNDQLKSLAESASDLPSVKQDVPVFAQTITCFAWFECYTSGFTRALEVLRRGRQGLKVLEGSRKEHLPDVRAAMKFLFVAEMDLAIHAAFTRFQSPQRCKNLRDCCVEALEAFPYHEDFLALALHLAGSVQISTFWERQLERMLAEAEVAVRVGLQRRGVEALWIGVAALQVWRFYRRTNHRESVQMLSLDMQHFPREDVALTSKYQLAVRRLRNTFKKALASHQVSQSPVFWKLYARAEMTAGRFKSGRKVLLKGLEKCQWHKELWLYAIYCISGKAEEFEDDRQKQIELLELAQLLLFCFERKESFIRRQAPEIGHKKINFVDLVNRYLGG